MIKQYFKNIWIALYTIFEGLAVTLANMVRKPITVQYPDRVPKRVAETLPDRYRGFLEVDTSICTACKICENACPIDCIYIEVGKNAEGVRGMSEFAIDIGKCMFCGLCVEDCPTGSIRFTTEFEGATQHYENLIFRFIKDGDFIIPYKVRKGVEITTKPRSEIVRAAIESARKGNFVKFKKIREKIASQPVEQQNPT